MYSLFLLHTRLWRPGAVVDDHQERARLTALPVSLPSPLTRLHTTRERWQSNDNGDQHQRTACTYLVEGDIS